MVLLTNLQEIKMDQNPTSFEDKENSPPSNIVTNSAPNASSGSTFQFVLHPNRTGSNFTMNQPAAPESSPTTTFASGTPDYALDGSASSRQDGQPTGVDDLAQLMTHTMPVTSRGNSNNQDRGTSSMFTSKNVPAVHLGHPAQPVSATPKPIWADSWSTAESRETQGSSGADVDMDAKRFEKKSAYSTFATLAKSALLADLANLNLPEFNMPVGRPLKMPEVRSFVAYLCDQHMKEQGIVPSTSASTSVSFSGPPYNPKPPKIANATTADIDCLCAQVDRYERSMGHVKSSKRNDMNSPLSTDAQQRVDQLRKRLQKELDTKGEIIDTFVTRTYDFGAYQRYTIAAARPRSEVRALFKLRTQLSNYRGDKVAQAKREGKMDEWESSLESKMCNAYLHKVDAEWQEARNKAYNLKLNKKCEEKAGRDGKGMFGMFGFGKDGVNGIFDPNASKKRSRNDEDETGESLQAPASKKIAPMKSSRLTSKRFQAMNDDASIPNDAEGDTDMANPSISKADRREAASKDRKAEKTRRGMLGGGKDIQSKDNMDEKSEKNDSTSIEKSHSNQVQKSVIGKMFAPAPGPLAPSYGPVTYHPALCNDPTDPNISTAWTDEQRVALTEFSYRRSAGDKYEGSYKQKIVEEEKARIRDAKARVESVRGAIPGKNLAGVETAHRAFCKSVGVTYEGSYLEQVVKESAAKIEDKQGEEDVDMANV